jgi:hypothetical protein
MNEIINLKTVNLCWENRKLLKEKYLRTIFIDLEGYQRKRLQSRIDSGEDIGNIKISAAGEQISINKLTEGWLDLNSISSDEMNKALSILLHETNPNINFSGRWKNKYEKEMLDQYLENEDHILIRKSIDHQAIDLTLELLDIRKRYDQTEEIKLIKNNLHLVTHNCRENDFEKDLVFEQKLIARRVLLGISRLFPKGDEKFSLNTICNLLKRDITWDEESEAQVDIGEIVNTKLGLYSKVINKNKGISKIVSTNDVMLREEANWIEEYGIHAILLRDYLDFIDFAIGEYDFSDFIDIGDLRLKIGEFLSQKPEYTEELKTRLAENISVNQLDTFLFTILEKLLDIKFP